MDVTPEVTHTWGDGVHELLFVCPSCARPHSHFCYPVRQAPGAPGARWWRCPYCDHDYKEARAAALAKATSEPS